MKIVVDGYELSLPMTGVGRVTHNLLSKLVPLFPDDEWVVLTRENPQRFSAANLSYLEVPGKPGFFRWQNGPFLKKAGEIGSDLLIAPNYTLPFFYRGASILMVHDVSFAAHPEWFSTKEAWVRKRLVGRSLSKATRVMTISIFSKKEILRYFRIDPEKIFVSRLGSEKRFSPPDSDQVRSWRRKKGIEGRTVVGFLGSIFIRRHIPVLIEAVERLRIRKPDTVLYLVGKDFSRPPMDLSPHGDREWLIWEEALPDEELPLFYASLDVFAYLSEYEGFGLPPMEALACGTVPLLLNRTALKEIYAGMALMVDNPDPLEVEQGLHHLLDNNTLKKEMLECYAGKKELYSWEGAAREFGRVLTEIKSQRLRLD